MTKELTLDDLRKAIKLLKETDPDYGMVRIAPISEENRKKIMEALCKEFDVDTAPELLEEYEAYLTKEGE